MDISTQLVLDIGWNRNPIFGTKYFYDGVFDNQRCILRACCSYDGASSYYYDLIKLEGIDCVPSPVFFKPSANPLVSPHSAFDCVCIRIPYLSVFHFFVNLGNIYDSGPKDITCFQFSKKHFENIFFSAMRGMIRLLEEGYVVRNVIFGTTVKFAGVDVNGQFVFKPYFLDIVPKTNDLVVEMIKDFRTLMKNVVEITNRVQGVSNATLETHVNNGVSEDILNFLIHASDMYIEFMGNIDPVHILFDPMIWNGKEKRTKILNLISLLDDNLKAKHNPLESELDIYYQTFPHDWKREIRRGSFFDVALTNQMQKVKTDSAKLALADKIIGGQKSVEDCTREYEDECEINRVVRGVDCYNHGLRCVSKMKRNGDLHYNQMALAARMPLKTLEGSLESVETEINFSCSKLFWFFNNIWFDLRPLKWMFHKDILNGIKSWEDDPDKDNPAEAAVPGEESDSDRPNAAE